MKPNALSRLASLRRSAQGDLPQGKLGVRWALTPEHIR